MRWCISSRKLGKEMQATKGTDDSADSDDNIPVTLLGYVAEPSAF